MSSEISSGPPLEPRAPQRQRGRDRVARLKAAAAELFLEKGYDAATMTEIAAKAGASIGSLYLFFPSKAALAQAMVSELAEALSARLDVLLEEMHGQPAGDVADALFDELSDFLGQHPVYAVLVELPGDDAWKQALRARRRGQVAALFVNARPALPPGQAERLAVIVPQLMRIPLTLNSRGPHRPAVLDELRTMLRRHLDPVTAPAKRR